MTTEPYRPSNGTAGDMFYADWCAKCRKEDFDHNPCPILTATLITDVRDPEYPKEWVEDDKGARCTAFEPGLPPTKADRAYAEWKQRVKDPLPTNRETLSATLKPADSVAVLAKAGNSSCAPIESGMSCESEKSERHPYDKPVPHAGAIGVDSRIIDPI